jgi:hypothetical protein
MTEAFRTPQDRFDAWVDYPFASHFHQWHGLHRHCLDVADAGHFLQESHGREEAGLILRRIDEERVGA